MKKDVRLSHTLTTKVMFYNIFAAEVITPTFGIISWAKEEVNNIDIKNPKILASKSSFHVSSNIDRLYSYRNKGGRALISLTDIYISRLVFKNFHLTEKSTSNIYLALVFNHQNWIYCKSYESICSMLPKSSRTKLTTQKRFI